MKKKAFTITALAILTTSLGACVAPSTNAPIYNINGTETQVSRDTTTPTTENAGATGSNGALNPSFTIASADDTNASVSSAATTVATAASNVGSYSQSSTALVQCEATQPFRIPRDAEKKPIYSQITKGSYKAKNYLVQQGDTLYLLGYLTGTSAEAVAKANGLSVNAILTPGTVIVVNPGACSGKETSVPTVAEQTQAIASAAPSTQNNPALATQEQAQQAQKAAQQAQQQAKQAAQQAANTAASAAAAGQPVADTAAAQAAEAAAQKAQQQAKQAQEAADRAKAAAKEQVSRVQGTATGSASFAYPTKSRNSIPNKNPNDKAIYFTGTIGDKVYASQDGLVIYSGVFNNYGNTVIISHNNGLLSLYACNSRNQVQSNQQVKKGQVIALMGNTCSFANTILYYQVRENGKAQDPLKYLAK